MKNTHAIGAVSGQIEMVCQRIGTMSASIEEFQHEGNENLRDTYEDLVLGELEQLQRLTLELTQLITQEDDVATASGENADDNGGSVFSEGELTSTPPAENAEGEEKSK